MLYSTSERVEMLGTLKTVDRGVVYKTIGIEELEKRD
jgi:hypothetical protein